MTLMTKEQKNTLANTTGRDRNLEGVEMAIIHATNTSAGLEYKDRILHTMTLIAQRAQRADIPIDAKLAVHIDSLTSQLFHLLMKQSHSADENAVNQLLDQLVASVYAYKVIIAKEKIQAQLR